MPTHSRRSFLAGIAGVAAGATFTVSSSRGAAAQGTPAATAAAAASAWSFVDDRGRTISLESTPTRIFADAMAAMSLWPYGIKPVGISGWLRGYTFPEEWDDVVRFDLEAGELDIEKLIELNPDLSVGITWDTVTKNDFGAVDESTMPGFTDVAPSLCILGVDVPISASIERFGELAAALGASTESETISVAREAFHAASDALRTAIEAKPGLTAIAISGALENAWLGNPSVASDLVYFAERASTSLRQNRRKSSRMASFS